MKLSHSLEIKLVALLASWLIRVWLSTLEMRFVIDGASSDPLRTERRNIYLFWHETMLFPAYAYARHRIAILVSRHRDGELLTQTIRMLRGVALRGSTDRGRSRGGSTALRAMMGHGRANHLAITPDGPRGPRRVVQIGAIYLASRSGMPLVPAGFAFEDCWRVGSWDRMALPRPWRRARCVIAGPIEVPPGIDRGRLEEYRQRVQSALEAAQARAERLADGEKTSRPLLTKAQALTPPPPIQDSATT